MKNKFFPIEKDPACLLKWNWSTIFFQSGTSASCHRTRKYKIDPENFDQFHNLPEKIIAREKMLSGEWPYNGCEYCKRVEDQGGVSDRIMQIDSLNSDSLVPPELLKNSNETSVTPTILEVYFTNTCNMKCVYCGPHFSSLWESEIKNYGSPFDDSTNQYDVKLSQNNDNYDQMIQDLWKYLVTDDRYLVLQRFHILGGEPFIIKETQQCIDFWKNNPNPDLTFSIISNLNVPHKIFKKYIDQFELLAKNNCIWRLQLTGSLDGWNKSTQEYSRYGLDTDCWEKNFEYCLDKPWIQLSINSALSCLTFKDFPELLKKIALWNKKQVSESESWIDIPGWSSKSTQIDHSFNNTSNIDDIYYFGNYFNDTFEEIIKLMPDEEPYQKAQKEHMIGLANAQKDQLPDIIRIQKLQKYLDLLDQRRNTNWRAVFPWLSEDFIV